MSDQPPLPPTTKHNPPRSFTGPVIGPIVGIAVGVLVALALLIAVELFSAVVHPFPPDLAGTQEEMCAHVARYPAWVLALVVPAWALTAFAATWTANRLGARPAAITIALLLTAAVLCNVSMLPYPFWFKILSVAGVLVGALFAIRIVRGHQ